MAAPARSIGRKETPVEAQKRILLEKQEKVRREMELVKAHIKRIPDEQKIREEQMRMKAAQEKERVNRLEAPPRTMRAVTGQPLRREKRQDVIKLFVLVMVLMGILFWIYMLRP